MVLSPMTINRSKPSIFVLRISSARSAVAIQTFDPLFSMMYLNSLGWSFALIGTAARPPCQAPNATGTRRSSSSEANGHLAVPKVMSARLKTIRHFGIIVHDLIAVCGGWQVTRAMSVSLDPHC